MSSAPSGSSGDDEAARYALVRDAIVRRLQVVATYRGLRREMCPHALGRKDGRAQCLFYQFGGESGSQRIVPGAVDNWRCIPVDELSDIEVREGTWFTAAIGRTRQSCVDSVDLETAP